MVRIQPFGGWTNRPPARNGSDLPVAAAQDGHALAVRGDPVHVDLGRADHEVDVLPAPVDTVEVLLVDEKLEARAEGKMARRVLVEERVVEDGAERADAAVTIDERELTKPERSLVDLEQPAQSLAVLVRVDLDGRPVLEADPQAAYDRPVA